MSRARPSTGIFALTAPCAKTVKRYWHAEKTGDSEIFVDLGVQPRYDVACHACFRSSWSNTVAPYLPFRFTLMNRLLAQFVLTSAAILTLSLCSSASAQTFVSTYYKIGHGFCMLATGMYSDGAMVEHVEAKEGRRVAGFSTFKDGVIIQFKTGGSVVAWRKQIDCNDPPYDPRDAASAPKVSAAPPGRVVAGLSAISNEPFAPGFSCAKARSNVEKLICSDRDLAASDVVLNRLYLTFLGKSSNKETARVEQAQWRRVRRDTCENLTCIREAYRQRNVELGSLLQTK